MSKIRFHAGRAAGICAAVVASVLLLIIQMTTASGLLPGLDPLVDDKQSTLINREKMKLTVEGQFVDRNGDPITDPGEPAVPGKPAQIVYDECYSYLIGYRTSKNQCSGLRKTLMSHILIGGADNIGAQVGLTTDNSLQDFCYDTLGKREGSVIVMEAHTGALLAITSRASAEMGYDADLYNKNYNIYDSYPAFWYDRSLYAEDPPGSTYKILTAAAMLENGMGDYVYDDNDGSYEIPGGGVVHNSGNRIYGSGINMEKALNNSINVYFASAAVDMASHRFEDMASAFGINKTIVTDFCRIESTLNIKTLSQTQELARAGFGQGTLAMSPLHISMIMGTVLNDGVMVVPHVIREIREDGADILSQIRPVVEEGEGEEGEEPSDSVVFSPETAATLKQYLHSTAVKYGYVPETYGTVYAKTGTADMADGNNHIYMLMGVESEKGDYVILIDVRNTDTTSTDLKDEARAILERVLAM